MGSLGDGVKKVFIRSGIRFDYCMADSDDTFMRELCENHISGQLRVAPEHISDNVLKRMGKPENSVYEAFLKRYDRINNKTGKKQYVVPYLMSSHPGSTMKEAIELAEYIRDLGYMPEQVQDFYPTPSTLSTCMYYTGYDPRTMESYMIQDTHLFFDSIRNNIRIARLDATDEDIENACKKASIHNFIMTLSKGYDTPVGELGDTLSGGEKQRIGLARVFLHDSDLVLLDEPTSNLDSLNEAVILKSIAKERNDKTVVLVSHRQSTMRIADRTYSVERGRVS